VEDRREDGKLETNGAGPPRPDPARLAPKLPGPIHWISTEPVSEDPPSAAPHPIGGVGPTTRAPRRSGSRCSSRAPPEASRHPALRLVAQLAPAPQRPFGVLLVDDNSHHRIPLLRALRDQGHSVLHAADGASGETLCRASQLEIDALVACADMKRMCGCELARRVVRMRPEVRVLLMWRHFAGPEEAHRAYGRGYAVIEEPFTPEELCRRLTGLLGSSREDEVLAIVSKKEN
jgi:CheY-like chemotaxis protein